MRFTDPKTVTLVGIVTFRIFWQLLKVPLPMLTTKVGIVKPVLNQFPNSANITDEAIKWKYQFQFKASAPAKALSSILVTDLLFEIIYFLP